MKEKQSGYFNKESIIKLTAKTVIATSIISGVGMIDNASEVNAETGINVNPIAEKDTYNPIQNFNNTLAALGVHIESVSQSEFPTRIAGMDRYDTAVEIAKQGWGKTGSKNVVLAYGGANEACLAEAIASGPLANVLKAPVLLTDGQILSQATVKEIKDLGATTVYVTSRNSIIEQTVLDQLSGLTIKPVWGEDSPSTSVEIAKTIASLNGKKIDTFALANGKVGSPDVLSIAPIASAKEFPILITDNTASLPKVVKDYLATLSITKSYVVGGTAVVSESQKSELANPVRLAGMDRYNTNAAVVKAFTEDNSINPEHVFVANGQTLVDAISGVTLAANFNSAIILTDGSNATDFATVKGLLKNSNGLFTALGGTSVVPESATGYKPELKAKVVEVEVTGIKQQALKYVAGGEYMNGGEFTNPLEELSVGATVVYSSSENMAAEKQEVLNYQSSLKSGDVVYCVAGKTYLVRPTETDIPGLYIKQEDIYDLSNMSKISFPKLCYDPAIRVDYKAGGLIATDFFRVTHDYKDGNWTERNNYEMLGTADQRMRKNLNKFLSATVYLWNETTKVRDSFNNPLSLDKTEVQKYCDTGSDEGFRSFKVMKYANGEPAFFVTTSEESGVGEKLLAGIAKAVVRLEEIDPGILKLMCERNGMNCVSFNIKGYDHDIFKGRGWAGSYRTYPFGEVVFMNKDLISIVEATPDSTYPRRLAAKLMLVESRALRYEQHKDYITHKFLGMDDVMSSKVGVNNEEADKYRFAIKYIERWLAEKKLTRKEYNHWFTESEGSLNAYDPSYQMTWKQLDESNFIPER